MGRNRFISGHTVRIELSDGDWIGIKSELSWGERCQLFGLARVSYDPATQEKAGVNWERYQIERAALFLTAWSFCGSDGTTMALSRETIARLDAVTAAEVYEAIDRHVDMTNKEKKASSTPSAGATVS